MPGQVGGLHPIVCAYLLRKVDSALVELLESLEPEEWDLPTIVPNWRVRDVAAHLLDTVLRKLSMVRDSWVVEPVEIRSDQDLVSLVNRLNQEGVIVYRRFSPRILTGLMKAVCEESARFHESLDPFSAAAFSVSWAGEGKSLNWFDTARELTERWHHQQQIRLATNRAGGMTPEIYYPVLDCFLRGLPFLYQKVNQPHGTVISVEITGECGGRWMLACESSKWTFVDAQVDNFAAAVSIPQEIAWRIFTKGCSRDWASTQIQVSGNKPLGEKILDLIAIVG